MANTENIQAWKIGAALKVALACVENDSGPCPLCGADYASRAERDERTRAEAEDIFAQYVAALDGDQARAVEIFIEDAPVLARSLGFRVTHPGFCLSCGSDRRTQSEAGLRATAEELLAQLIPEFAGSRAAALAALREDAPTMASYITETWNNHSSNL